MPSASPDQIEIANSKNVAPLPSGVPVGPSEETVVGARIPGVAAVIDDIVVGFEDSVREPIVAHVLPNVFDRIEVGGFRRQCENGDVGGNEQSCRQMPSGL